MTKRADGAVTDYRNGALLYREHVAILGHVAKQAVMAVHLKADGVFQGWVQHVYDPEQGKWAWVTLVPKPAGEHTEPVGLYAEGGKCYRTRGQAVAVLCAIPAHFFATGHHACHRDSANTCGGIGCPPEKRAPTGATR